MIPKNFRIGQLIVNADLHSLQTKSGGEEWRPDIDVQLEKASELLKDPYDDARIFLQLQADDIEYKPEEIGGLKEYPPDQRDAMIAAIMKEIGDLCKIGVFSLEVIPNQSKPLSTKLVLKIKRDHELGMIRPYWCPGNYNVADFFSKLLEKGLFTMHAHRFGMNFEETVVGKLAEVYQTVHLKEFTDFPKKDEKDPTTVFTDIHFEKKSVAYEAYHLSHGFCL